ncbi:MAG: phosphoadenylyl-sulfate reductase [Bacteroidales bacterium]|nr:phosphoadenylyl-sulfate reductase [Bacteroidales bacterium]
MDTAAIRQKIQQYQAEGKRLFATSSFQTNSVVLLHVLSRIDKTIPVYFINTGFHFPETIRYKEEVARLLGLHLTDLLPHVPKAMQCNAAGDLMFTFDPDYCCYLNKVQPVESLLEQYDVWISGVRAEQNNIRKGFRKEEKTQHNTLKYHPLLDWSSKDMKVYIARHALPVHPLEEQGYRSIGCEPCTRPANGDKSRDARWAGMKKTECGLHVMSRDIP